MLFNKCCRLRKMYVKAGVCSSFIKHNCREQHPRSHHKGTTSMQTHLAGRVQFKPVWGMRVDIVSVLPSISAFLMEMKRIHMPHSLFWDC